MRFGRIWRPVELLALDFPSNIAPAEEAEPQTETSFYAVRRWKGKKMDQAIAYCEILSYESPEPTECWHKLMTGKTLRQLELTLQEKALFKVEALP